MNEEYYKNIVHGISEVATKALKKPLSECMNDILKTMGLATKVSRVYIFKRKINTTYTQKYEWVDDGISKQLDNENLIDLDIVEAGFNRWQDAFDNNDLIKGNIDKFPNSETQILSDQEILSLVVVPIYNSENIWGFIGFDECKFQRSWDLVEISLLQTVAEIIGAAVEKSKIIRDLEETSSRLEKANSFLVNREIKMKELKDEIKYLKDVL